MVSGYSVFLPVSEAASEVASVTASEAASEAASVTASDAASVASSVSAAKLMVAGEIAMHPARSAQISFFFIFLSSCIYGILPFFRPFGLRYIPAGNEPGCHAMQ